MDHDRKHWRWCGLLALVVLVAGCGGSELGGEIRIPAGQHHSLTAEQTKAGPINLPADRKFNIHIKTSRRDPGADGTASSDSDATGDGQASCRAEASNGGSAWADFNIGHRIANRTGSAQSVHIDLAYGLQQEIAASRQPAPKTVSAAHLDLVVLDSHKRPIARMVVLGATSDDATATVTNQDRRTLTVRLEPNEAYDLMLFGKVEATAEADQKAAARLKVSGLTMRLTFSPAATQPAEP